MRTYRLYERNPVFLLQLLDEFGAPGVGVTAPTVYRSVSQAAGNAIVPWIEGTARADPEGLGEAIPLDDDYEVDPIYKALRTCLRSP